MAGVIKKRIGKNELWWLQDGPGGHGATAKRPETVVSSLKDKFQFVEEIGGSSGLRTPQLGALHAILAHKSMETNEPITVVMPTGTGKTETMLSAFAHSPARTLVIVPSNNLRSQISQKFATFGILNSVGALKGTYFNPVVAVLKSSLKTVQECNDLIGSCNVVVSTASAFSGCTEVARDRLIELCDTLYIDEAHHVAARTWKSVAELFAGKAVVQFTATPFREDGKHLGGRIAYAYPLRLAQKHGYFAKINYKSILDIGDVDRLIAETAIEQLRADIAAGKDHLLMARVQTIPRAEEVLRLYEEIASDLNPVRIDSKMSEVKQKAALARITSSDSRVIVCVDMLGEGFDLKTLKVAAIHDPHKSLAVTLQFIGRFARVGGDELGDASVFVPRPTGDIDDRLRRLYGEDADWNILIRDLSQTEVDLERERTDFEVGFTSIPDEVVMKSVQPKMSTVVFRTAELEWNPEAVYEMFGEDQLLTKRIAINDAAHVVWFVTAEQVPVAWGDFSNFREVIHNLYIVHCDLESGLLYINSSNNDGVHEDLAKAIGGESVEVIRGDVVYRVLGSIARRVPTNVGLLDAVNRNRRFSMHVGADVLEGFGPGAAQKSKTNIFAHGYSNGNRVSFGASRKGRIWSHRVANTILDWVNWVRIVGALITDESISVASVLQGFIIPTAATERPDLVPLGIEWPYFLIGNTSESRLVSFAGEEIPLLDLDLEIIDRSNTGPIKFEVKSDNWTAKYLMTFGDQGPVISADGADATIATTAGPQRLSEYMTKKGMLVYFEKEAVLSPDGYIIQPDRSRQRFDSNSLEVVDWDGVNIRTESQGPERRTDTVQFRAIEILSGEADWEVIIDDDGSGEVADVVSFRRNEGTLEVQLTHCKFSSGDTPGARLADLYELCGQAVKSHKARSEVELVIRKLIRRENRRQKNGQTGFIKGDGRTLMSILNEARMLDVKVTVELVQPGLSKLAFTTPLSELLGCTQLYLSETYNSAMRVMCSE
jgi:superfamily II DNA or RNA helicase